MLTEFQPGTREVVPLLCALVDHVARTNAIRALSIKGPAFNALGIERPASADVDVLVHPLDFDRIVGALAECGWGDSYEPETTRAVLTPHSVTLWHRLWPTTVDVHRFFPGVLAPADDAFEALWESRCEVEVANYAVQTVEPAAAAVIWGLNAVRSGDEVPEPLQLQWCGYVRSHSTPEAVVATALALGATQTLHGLLARLELPIPAPVHVNPTALRRWALNQSDDVRGLAIALRLRESHPRNWPGHLRAGLWPAGATPAENLARLRVGVMHLPTMVRTLYRHSRTSA